MKIISSIETSSLNELVHEYDGVLVPFLDIESFGKEIRQKNRKMVSAKLSYDDLLIIPEAVRHLCLVRTDNLLAGGVEQINALADSGYKQFMLPYIDSQDHVNVISKLPVGCSYIPLIETVFSLENLEDIKAQLDFSYFHLGLNDLSIQLGLSGPMEVLTHALFIDRCKRFSLSEIDFGIGGIGSLLAKEKLKVDPKSLMDTYKALGSKGVILSRAFHSNVSNARYVDDFKTHLNEIIFQWRK